MQSDRENMQSRNQQENENRIKDLQQKVADYQDQIGRSQAEVEIRKTLFCTMSIIILYSVGESENALCSILKIYIILYKSLSVSL